MGLKWAPEWEGRLWGTEPLTCGIGCCLWVDSVRIEVNGRILSWCQTIAGGVAELPTIGFECRTP